MVLFNYATRELTAKIVYYGPGLCGKTTNLEYIHKSLPEQSRGKMLSLATQTDRTLFFDFLPLDLGSIKGMKTRVQLYTVPGQVFYDATRKLVLKGADGVVFVVDSQAEMVQSNLESWDNLKKNLIENGLDIRSIPVVMQYNKRDLNNILPVKTLNEKINELKVPYHEAVAIKGIGVQETLKTAAKVVLLQLAQRLLKQGKEEEQPQEQEAEELQEVITDSSTVYTSIPLGKVSDGPPAQQFEELEELQEVQTIEEHVPAPAVAAVAGKVPYATQAVLNEKTGPLQIQTTVTATVPKQPPKPQTAPLKSEVKPQSQPAAAEMQEVIVPVDVTLDKNQKEVNLRIQINLKINVTRG